MASTAVKTMVIDSDAHVVEGAHTWDFMDPEDEKYRPALVEVPGETRLQYWLIGGRVRGFRFPAFSQAQLEQLSRTAGRSMTTRQEASEMTDVALRLEHMDRLGIDVQVLHNTMFIEQVTDEPAVEVAICKSWNRWLADIWSKGQGRLRWSCVLPYLSLPDAIDQMRFAKQNGACAVLMRPVEGHRQLIDPYFDPVFDEASRLDLAIAVHIANGNPWLTDFFKHPIFIAAAFQRFRIPTVGAVHDLLLSDVPQRFPKLRFAFIEASAQWIPWIFTEARKRFQQLGRPWPENIARDYRIWVTCENSDEIPTILRYCGDDCLLIGTDYGHTDPSSDIDAIKTFRQRTDLSEDVKHKILDDNARAVYAL
jgi:predicted TIM-barrel fold metal-dependent hydrolase